MAKFSKSFESKIDLFLDSRIGRQLYEFENMSACAGIKNDKWNAYKAKVNHYGGVLPYKRASIKQVGSHANGKPHLKSVWTKAEIRIPARPFMDVTLDRNSWLLGYFEEQVAQILSGGHARSYKIVNGYRTDDTPSQMTSSGGAKSTLQAVANALADNIRDSILMATPPNAPSTVKRKGFDGPLTETFEMYDSIRGWVEK